MLIGAVLVLVIVVGGAMLIIGILRGDQGTGAPQRAPMSDTRK